MRTSKHPAGTVDAAAFRPGFDATVAPTRPTPGEGPDHPRPHRYARRLLLVLLGAFGAWLLGLLIAGAADASPSDPGRASVAPPAASDQAGPTADVLNTDLLDNVLTRVRVALDAATGSADHPSSAADARVDPPAHRSTPARTSVTESVTTVVGSTITATTTAVDRTVTTTLAATGDTIDRLTGGRSAPVTSALTPVLTSTVHTTLTTLTDTVTDTVSDTVSDVVAPVLDAIGSPATGSEPADSRPGGPTLTEPVADPLPTLAANCAADPLLTPLAGTGAGTSATPGSWAESARAALAPGPGVHVGLHNPGRPDPRPAPLPVPSPVPAPAPAPTSAHADAPALMQPAITQTYVPASLVRRTPSDQQGTRTDTSEPPVWPD